MDIDKLKRRQNIKVIISEALMVIAMIAIVAVLALVVSGYWLNSDFEVERQGMLQISSVPAGADLIIDGESPSWFQRTNSSKILAVGEHEINLQKEGYDSWSRTIKISEGLLYRIHYPRLFFQERTAEKVYDTTKFTSATVSPNNKLMLLLGDTTEWTLLNLDNDILKPEKINIANVFSGVSLPAVSAEDVEETTASTEATTEAKTAPEAKTPPVGVFNSKILSSSWDKNSEHILFRVASGDKTEWVLLDITNVKNSINLTKEFNINFDNIKIFNNSASVLIALENGNLRKIDTKNKTISATLAKNVADFDYYDNEIIFAATRADSSPAVTEAEPEAEPTPTAPNPERYYYLGTFKLGSSEVEELDVFPQPFKFAILQFYDNKHIAVLSGNRLVLHQKTDYEKATTFELSFDPAQLTVGHQGEFITMVGDYDGQKIATLDMEDNSIREWSVDGEKFDWLSTDMIYSVKDGNLFVYDFDGLNRRELAKNVSTHFPVTITNDKWLYYFSDGFLIREVIVK